MLSRFLFLFFFSLFSRDRNRWKERGADWHANTNEWSTAITSLTGPSGNELDLWTLITPGRSAFRPPSAGSGSVDPEARRRCSRPELIIQPRSIMPCTDTRRSRRFAKCLYFAAVLTLMDFCRPWNGKIVDRDGSWYPWGGEELLFPLRVCPEKVVKVDPSSEYFIIGALVRLFVCFEDVSVVVKLRLSRGVEDFQ